MPEENNASSYRSLEPLVQRILAWIDDGVGPVAVHAGHFMLLASGEKCVPAVLEEIDPGEEATRGLIETLIARFPIETWRVGLSVAKAVREQRHQVGVMTLVNDWYFLRRLPAGQATRLRKRFYDNNKWLLRSFASELDRFSLDESVIDHIGPHRAFVSEYWLRRRAERRLKRLAKATPERGAEVRWRTSENGEKELICDALGRECRLLLCGHADCADEVMELLCVIHDAGYRRFVNLIPRECECPVNAGCKRAIALFDLDDLAVLNIALPCLGGGFRDADVLKEAVAHHVYADRLDDGTLEPVVESKWWQSWGGS